MVRNLATTHMLDRVAESFGEKCYEAPWDSSIYLLKCRRQELLLGETLRRTDSQGAYLRKRRYLRSCSAGGNDSGQQ